MNFFKMGWRLSLNKSLSDFVLYFLMDLVYDKCFESKNSTQNKPKRIDDKMWIVSGMFIRTDSCTSNKLTYL